MSKFYPQFNAIIETQFGQQFLNFLREDKTLVMMTTATYLGRPAIEALVPALEERFGEQLKAIQSGSNNPENIDYDRLKQTMGHMVKVIMEENGYEIDQNNVKIPDGRNTIFSRATRYKKSY
jgi:hypothetical protein